MSTSSGAWLSLVLAILAAGEASGQIAARPVAPGGWAARAPAAAPAWIDAVGNLFSAAPRSGIRWEGSLRALSRIRAADPARGATLAPLASALERLGHTPESFSLLDPDAAAGEARHAMAMAETAVRTALRSELAAAKELFEGPESADAGRGVQATLSLMTGHAVYGAYLDAPLREEIDRARTGAVARYGADRAARLLEFFAEHAELLRSPTALDALVAYPQSSAAAPRPGSVLARPGKDLPRPDTREPESPELTDRRRTLERALAHLDAVQARLAARPAASARDVAASRRVLAELDHAERRIEWRLADLYGEEAAGGGGARDRALRERELEAYKRLRETLAWARLLSAAQVGVLQSLSEVAAAGLLEPPELGAESTAWSLLASAWNRFWGVDQRNRQRARSAYVGLLAASRSLEAERGELADRAAPAERWRLVEAAPNASFAERFRREDASLAALDGLTQALRKAAAQASWRVAPSDEQRRLLAAARFRRAAAQAQADVAMLRARSGATAVRLSARREVNPIDALTELVRNTEAEARELSLRLPLENDEDRRSTMRETLRRLGETRDDARATRVLAAATERARSALQVKPVPGTSMRAERLLAAVYQISHLRDGLKTDLSRRRAELKIAAGGTHEGELRRAVERLEGLDRSLGELSTGLLDALEKNRSIEP